MTHQDWLIVLTRLAEVTAGVVLALLLWKFFKVRPCWFFNHKMKHLSIELRVWLNDGICHRCNEALAGGHYLESYRHRPHVRKDGSRIECYVTKWICAKPGCGEMGMFCVGDTTDGAWTIHQGEIVPDEKTWSHWPDSKKEASR